MLLSKKVSILYAKNSMLLVTAMVTVSLMGTEGKVAELEGGNASQTEMSPAIKWHKELAARVAIVRPATVAAQGNDRERVSPYFLTLGQIRRLFSGTSLQEDVSKNLSGFYKGDENKNLYDLFRDENTNERVNGLIKFLYKKPQQAVLNQYIAGNEADQVVNKIKSKIDLGVPLAVGYGGLMLACALYRDGLNPLFCKGLGYASVGYAATALPSACLYWWNTKTRAANMDLIAETIANKEPKALFDPVTYQGLDGKLAQEKGRPYLTSALEAIIAGGFIGAFIFNNQLDQSLIAWRGNVSFPARLGQFAQEQWAGMPTVDRIPSAVVDRLNSVKNSVGHGIGSIAPEHKRNAGFFAAALGLFGIVKKVFFPGQTRDQFYAELKRSEPVAAPAPVEPVVVPEPVEPVRANVDGAHDDQAVVPVAHNLIDRVMTDALSVVKVNGSRLPAQSPLLDARSQQPSPADSPAVAAALFVPLADDTAVNVQEVVSTILNDIIDSVPVVPGQKGAAAAAAVSDGSASDGELFADASSTVVSHHDSPVAPDTAALSFVTPFPTAGLPVVDQLQQSQASVSSVNLDAALAAAQDASASSEALASDDSHDGSSSEASSGASQRSLTSSVATPGKQMSRAERNALKAQQRRDAEIAESQRQAAIKAASPTKKNDGSPKKPKK